VANDLLRYVGGELSDATASNER